MEKGELNKIVLDAYKVLLDKLAIGSKWLSESMNIFLINTNLN